MTQRLAGTIMILGSLCAAARLQATDTASTSALDALLAEVRLLRQAIERQGTLAGRAQLLLGKLTLQDQRVVQWHTEAQRLESEASNAAQRRAGIQARLAESRTAIERARDAGQVAPEQVAGWESEVRMLQAQLKQESASLEALEARRIEAAQALEAERARYEELSGRFDRLERDLEPPSRSQR